MPAPQDLERSSQDLERSSQDLERQLLEKFLDTYTVWQYHNIGMNSSYYPKGCSINRAEISHV